MHEAINELKKYTLGKRNTEKVEISVLQINRVIKELEQEPKWIPVSEQLPKENSGYLVTVKRGYVTTALWVGNAEFWNEVTAWMPLPKPWKGEHDG